MPNLGGAEIIICLVILILIGLFVLPIVVAANSKKDRKSTTRQVNTVDGNPRNVVTDKRAPQNDSVTKSSNDPIHSVNQHTEDSKISGTGTRLKSLENTKDKDYKAPTEAGNPKRKQILYEILVSRFSLSDLEDLCFKYDLVGFEEIGGETIREKSRKLIQHCENRDKIDELIAAVNQERPDSNI